MLKLHKDPPKSKAPPATLLERQEILLYCLKTTRYKAHKCSYMMSPDMDADDIQSEVSIRVWKAMTRKEYLKKTYDELTRIGYVVAKNHIAQMVRDRLSILSRGSKIKHISLGSPQVYAAVSLLLGKNYYNMSSISKVLMFETITNEAINLVGLGHYKALLRAIPYDWSNELEHELTVKQGNILSNLDCSQEDIIHDLHLLAIRVRKRMKSEVESDTYSSKVNGMWAQNTEMPRHVLGLSTA